MVVVLTFIIVISIGTNAFAQGFSTHDDVNSGIVINGKYYTDEEFKEFLVYIERSDEELSIIPRIATIIPAWAIGQWIIPIAGTMVTIYVTPTLIRVGEEIINTTSQTFNNILDSIKQAKQSKKSGKDMATDVPSWARGNRPHPGESGNDFADRLCDEKYGKGNYRKGAGTEHNEIRKWGDRGFN